MNSAMIKAFAALEAHRSAVTTVPLRKRFADDPERFKRFSMSFRDLLLDYSKNLVDAEAMTPALRAGQGRRCRGRRAAMFSGEPINRTENRPVLHVALRAMPDEVYRVAGKNVVPEVHNVLDRMAAFADGVRSGAIKGDGGTFTDVVNIGIGGSDLGPRMAIRALAPWHDRTTPAFRLQCRRRRYPRHARRARSGAHPVPRRVEDLHHDRDHDQRRHGAGLDRRGARRGAGRGPLRGDVDRDPQSQGIRHRPRTAPSASGTGSAAATRSGRRSACR